MKVEITEVKGDVLEVGDMLVVQDKGCEPMHRLIYKCGCHYASLDLEQIRTGLENNTLDGLLSDYKSIYHSVKIIKRENIKITGVMRNEI